MNTKAKGTNAERELLHKFWSKNWACIRVAGSGSQKYPSPDLIVGNKIRKLGIECKISSNNIIYLESKEVKELDEFCYIFGLEPWVAVRFKDKIWKFLSLEDLKTTNKNFKVDLDVCRLKGVLFEELTSSYPKE